MNCKERRWKYSAFHRRTKRSQVKSLLCVLNLLLISLQPVGKSTGIFCRFLSLPAICKDAPCTEFHTEEILIVRY